MTTRGGDNYHSHLLNDDEVKHFKRTRAPGIRSGERGRGCSWAKAVVGGTQPQPAATQEAGEGGGVRERGASVTCD